MSMLTKTLHGVGHIHRQVYWLDVCSLAMLQLPTLMKYHTKIQSSFSHLRKLMLTYSGQPRYLYLFYENVMRIYSGNVAISRVV